jgi:hypothetical protein
MADPTPVTDEVPDDPAGRLGQKLKLKRNVGNDFDADGAPLSPLLAGWIGTVVRFVPSHHPGAHTLDEDSYVVDFPTGGVGHAEDGTPFLVQVARSVSFSLDDLNDPSLFEKVEG